MFDQSAGHVGRETDRRFAGGKLARAESSGGALPGGTTDRIRRFKIGGIASGGVPIVPLHFLTLLCVERAAQRVTRTGNAREKAKRIPVDARMTDGAQRAAFRIGDPRVDLAPRCYAAMREIDRLLRRERPRMGEIEVGNVARQSLRFDQTRVGGLSGIASYGTCLFDVLPDRLAAQVRRTGRALALTEVHGDSETPVALVLSRIYLAEAHGHAQPLAHIGVCLALRRASAAGFFQNETDDIL